MTFSSQKKLYSLLKWAVKKFFSDKNVSATLDELIQTLKLVVDDMLESEDLLYSKKD